MLNPLLTDNGTNYTSKQFKNFLSENKVIHSLNSWMNSSLSSPYNPQTNAACEKTKGTIVEKLWIVIKKESPKVVNSFTWSREFLQ